MVQRYGGTVDKFTGDGDHGGVRCAGGVGGSRRSRLSGGVGCAGARRSGLPPRLRERDGVELRLRVGLNSGQVIAGEIGSGSLGYTAIGEQVGMAQRMESVAPPGGVMLSASTARLVDGAAALGEPELVRIKGADEPVAARRLLGMGEQHRAVGRCRSRIWSVGEWEMSAVEGLLDRAVDGHGAVVGVVGPPGIGKSRLVREAPRWRAAAGRGVLGLLRVPHQPGPVSCGGAAAARGHRRQMVLTGRPPVTECATRFPTADAEDLLLFDDLLGIADPEAAASGHRSGCASAAVDRAGECRVVGPTRPRRSM